uniref:Odorant binding protein n=1 Tax=Dendrolimus houi TaxID=765132 RepID=A0A076E927_9NEOP|nr:odorant binding protein [Dendrolimus houi]
MGAYLFMCLMLTAVGLEAHTIHLTHTQKDKAHQLTMECMKESNVKPEVITEAKKGHYADDEKLKKFTLCFFQKAGILTPDAKLNVDTALEKLPPGVDKAEATKVLEECKNKTGKDKADTAFEIFKCYHHGTKTHILF